MNFDELSDEIKAKARNVKSPAELAALAEQEGIELTDEQIDAVAGGFSWCGDKEPCNSHQNELPDA